MHRAVKAGYATILSALFLVSVCGAAGFLLQDRDANKSRGFVPAQSAPPSPEKSPSDNERPPFIGFQPQAESSEGMSTLPASFPDGTRTRFEYPAHLKVHDHDWRPTGSFEVENQCSTIFLSSYGTDAPFHASDSPLETYESRSADQVELWESYPKDPALRYLVFKFSKWYVAIADTTGRCVTDVGVDEWIDNLKGQVVANGSLEMAVADPIRFRDVFLTVTDNDLYMDIWLGKQCALSGKEGSRVAGAQVRRSEGFANWCAPDQRIHFQAYSDSEERLDQLVEGLRGQASRS
jgi:hypothetical protein